MIWGKVEEDVLELDYSTLLETNLRFVFME